MFATHQFLPKIVGMRKNLLLGHRTPRIELFHDVTPNVLNRIQIRGAGWPGKGLNPWVFSEPGPYDARRVNRGIVLIEVYGPNESVYFINPRNKMILQNVQIFLFYESSVDVDKRTRT